MELATLLHIRVLPFKEHFPLYTSAEKLSALSNTLHYTLFISGTGRIFSPKLSIPPKVIPIVMQPFMLAKFPSSICTVPQCVHSSSVCMHMPWIPLEVYIRSSAYIGKINNMPIPTKTIPQEVLSPQTIIILDEMLINAWMLFYHLVKNTTVKAVISYTYRTCLVNQREIEEIGAATLVWSKIIGRLKFTNKINAAE